MPTQQWMRYDATMIKTWRNQCNNGRGVIGLFAGNTKRDFWRLEVLQLRLLVQLCHFQLKSELEKLRVNQSAKTRLSVPPPMQTLSSHTTTNKKNIDLSLLVWIITCIYVIHVLTPSNLKRFPPLIITQFFFFKHATNSPSWNSLIKKNTYCRHRDT